MTPPDQAQALDLKSLREIAEKATPGPWRLRTNRHETTDGYPWGWVSENTDRNINLPNVRIHWERPQGRANALHIATFAPPTVLSLISLADEAGRLREALTEIKRVAERIYHLEETGTVAALRIVEIVKTTEALSTPSEAPNAD